MSSAGSSGDQLQSDSGILGSFSPASSTQASTKASAHTRPLWLHPSDVIVVQVTEYFRNPKSFYDCLDGNPDLKRCREVLRAAGHNVQVGGGAEIFVHPDYYDPVVEHLRTKGVILDNSGKKLYLYDLKRRHVISGEEFQTIIAEAAATVSARERAKPKDDAEIAVMSQWHHGPAAVVPPRDRPQNEEASPAPTEVDSPQSEEEAGHSAGREYSACRDNADLVEVDTQHAVKNTFIHIQLPTSIGARTASTSDAHSIPNPRKRRKVEDTASAHNSQSLPPSFPSMPSQGNTQEGSLPPSFVERFDEGFELQLP